MSEDADRYESAVRAWCAVPSNEHRRANQLMDELQKTYKQTRETNRGRTLIERLTGDADLCVRVAAAVHALKWNPDMARQVLLDAQEMEGDWETAGQFATNAKWSLSEFDAGRLNLHW